MPGATKPAKAQVVDTAGHAAFEGTQYVTSTLRIRNVPKEVDEKLLLELFSQVGFPVTLLSS